MAAQQKKVLSIKHKVLAKTLELSLFPLLSKGRGGRN